MFSFGGLGDAGMDAYRGAFRDAYNSSLASYGGVSIGGMNPCLPHLSTIPLPQPCPFPVCSTQVQCIPVPVAQPYPVPFPILIELVYIPICIPVPQLVPRLCPVPVPQLCPVPVPVFGLPQ
ncbi:unnamed protein product [Rotaria sordida]|uniref:Uncharacterized protein n=1 Tax=Rotaria sordida TaxID=392033 RepID=A0A815ZFE6_9BILA|nr:unnamed protein product [Rotaria sordida]CAF1583884.1 unnamed protein product [Rotaria sordida]